MNSAFAQISSSNICFNTFQNFSWTWCIFPVNETRSPDTWAWYDKGETCALSIIMMMIMMVMMMILAFWVEVFNSWIDTFSMAFLAKHGLLAATLARNPKPSSSILQLTSSSFFIFFFTKFQSESKCCQGVQCNQPLGFWALLDLNATKKTVRPKKHLQPKNKCNQCNFE